MGLLALLIAVFILTYAYLRLVLPDPKPSQVEAFNKLYASWRQKNAGTISRLAFEDLLRATMAAGWNAGVDFGKLAKKG